MGAGGVAEASVRVWRHDSSEDTAGTGCGAELVRVISASRGLKQADRTEFKPAWST